MYLHIGNDVALLKKNIIAVVSGKFAEPNKTIIKDALSKDNTIRSTVITDNAIYWSPINPTTLQKRAADNNLLSDGGE